MMKLSTVQSKYH